MMGDKVALEETVKASSCSPLVGIQCMMSAIYIHKTNHRIAIRSDRLILGRAMLIPASVVPSKTAEAAPAAQRMAMREDSLAEYPGITASTG